MAIVVIGIWHWHLKTHVDNLLLINVTRAYLLQNDGERMLVHFVFY